MPLRFLWIPCTDVTSTPRQCCTISNSGGLLQNNNTHKQQQQQQRLDCLTLCLYTQGAVTAQCWLTAQRDNKSTSVDYQSACRSCTCVQVKHTCRAHTEGVADDSRVQVFTPPSKTCQHVTAVADTTSTVQLFRQRGHRPNRPSQASQVRPCQLDPQTPPTLYQEAAGPTRKVCLPRLQLLTGNTPPHNLAPAEDNCYQAEETQMVRVQLKS
jgi:hypothetical protein